MENRTMGHSHFRQVTGQKPIETSQATTQTSTRISPDWWNNPQTDSITDYYAPKPNEVKRDVPIDGNTGTTHDSVMRDIKVIPNPSTEVGFSVVFTPDKSKAVRTSEKAFFKAVGVVKQQISTLAKNREDLALSASSVSDEHAIKMVAEAAQKRHTPTPAI